MLSNYLTRKLDQKRIVSKESPKTMVENIDTLVIGGGQAGLAMSEHLPHVRGGWRVGDYLGNWILI